MSCQERLNRLLELDGEFFLRFLGQRELTHGKQSNQAQTMASSEARHERTSEYPESLRFSPMNIHIPSLWTRMLSNSPRSGNGMGEGATGL